jgi:hypothetical protein
MPDAGDQHHHTGDAMAETAPFEGARAEVADRRDPPGLGIAQHKTSHHQQNKADHQHSVLEAFMHRHAQIEAVLNVLLLDQPLLDGKLAAHFLEEIERVVDKHAAHDDHDHPNVDVGDEPDDRVVFIRRARGARGSIGAHMHGPHGEACVGTGVTLAAGLHEVRLVYSRCRIEMRFDRVSVMAARAVHHFNRTATRRESVVAVGKGLKRFRGQSVFLREFERGMATRADLLGNVALVNGRIGVSVGLDLMLAVAVGADGRVEVALLERDGVNAAGVLGGRLFVAFRAGGGLVLLVDSGAGYDGTVHIVRAMAVDTVGRLGLALMQSRAMHALVEAGNKAVAAQRLVRDGRFFNVAGFAKLGLGELELHRRSVAAVGHGLLVAGQAERGVGAPGSEGLAVGGGGELFVRSLVAFAAALDLLLRREGCQRGTWQEVQAKASTSGANLPVKSAWKECFFAMSS